MPIKSDRKTKDDIKKLENELRVESQIIADLISDLRKSQSRYDKVSEKIEKLKQILK